MKTKTKRLSMGIALMLALTTSAFGIVRENWQLWQLRRVAAYVAQEAPNVPVIIPNRYERLLLFYINPQASLALYEPQGGTYLGAYIRSDRIVDGQIGRFEQLMGRHSIYKYQLHPDDPFPEDFMQEIILRGRVPFFALTGSICDWDPQAALALARELQHHTSPMFVQPPKPERGTDPEGYKDSFLRIRRMFFWYAPHVAFVYAVDKSEADIALEFYPGDRYVDWVGLRALASMSPERQFKGDMLSAVNEVYFAFSQRKPMFVSVGISRQSNYDFIHRPLLAAAELKRVYTALLEDYPRVKGIIYYSFNEIQLDRNQNISDNYLITGDDVLKSIYREFLQHPSVINTVSTENQDTLISQKVRSRYGALRVNGAYYADQRALQNDLQIPLSRLRGRYRTQNGRRYYPLANLVRNGSWTLQSGLDRVTLEPVIYDTEEN